MSRAGKWLVRTSLEIRSRPYSYKDTPQLELDSFVTYATSVDFRVRETSATYCDLCLMTGNCVVHIILCANLLCKHYHSQYMDNFILHERGELQLYIISIPSLLDSIIIVAAVCWQNR